MEPGRLALRKTFPATPGGADDILIGREVKSTQTTFSDKL